MLVTIPIGLSTEALKFLGCAGSAFAVGLFAYGMATDAQSLPRRFFRRYVAYLERTLREVFLMTPAAPIALTQILLIGAAVFAWLVVGFSYGGLVALAIAVAPILYIARLRSQRIKKLDEQIDQFLLALTNALRTTPSIANAFSTVAPLLPNPMREEIDLVLKELRIGASIDQALLHMSVRTRLDELDAALSSVMIGRQVGGDLIEILATTATSIREMRRLAGVVRTKTASGRIQFVVLAVAPIAVVLAFEAASPGYFEPLMHSFVGGVVMVAATALWIVGTGVARKILAVEL